MPLALEIRQFILSFESRWDGSVNTACQDFFEARHSSAGPLNPDHPIKYEKNVKYGPDSRHRLDVFWPADAISTNAALPVVVYFHGGAFKLGDNSITPHMHANIGRFFASQGMIGVLGTYRLLPEARFPDGQDDVASALSWLHDNVHQYGGNRDAIFALGQSAGGGHLAMALFSGKLKSDQGQSLVRGVLLLSAALKYDLSKKGRRESMEQYYGTTNHSLIQSRSAYGIFQDLPPVEDADVASVPTPELFLMLAEWDFAECVQGNLDFVRLYAERRRRLPRFEVLPGHNHVSYALSIGLPGDEVGPKIADWVRQRSEGA
ncbi:alpha/beta hydrolase [Aspergillus vadensis CBS 113365]|uniref:Alpha/beta-hydrolase n=1 Tax=Aspergillus vadensis (strain CBS 113365 / IMI 142717 / IBT 24658) TaxID=1448311 RepID=A0A319C787_ASPVC|nr:alpha/beta-hydrolase [Aspergillus vadensis CBS 113365]PYH71198.1 alpha/beta-hydrolase [Aspergillus vadensis CBS 113365]